VASDRVTLLGTKGGPAIYPGATVRMPTATLVEMAGHRIVVDCGLGVTRALVGTGMHLRDLATVIVTHLHSDHYLELGPLIHTAWTAGLKTPVAVYGPAGLAACWEAFLRSMAFDIETRIADEGRPDLAGLVHLHTIGEGGFAEIGDVAVSAIRNAHPPITDSYAVKFEAGGKAVVLSGDTAPIDAMADFARGADLLVHEAMLEAGVQAIVDRVGHGAGDNRLLAHILRSHTPAGAVAQIAARARVKALALNHLIPDNEPGIGEADWRAAVAPHFAGALHIGHDGMEIAL